MSRNQSYKVAVAIAVLSGASVLIMVSLNPFVFVFPAATYSLLQQQQQIKQVTRQAQT
jgi:hypothetical protein